MNISTFINQYKRMVFLLAGRTAGKFAYKVGKDDLSQEGFLELLRLYESGKIDWENPGLTSFLWKRVEGRMENFAIKEMKTMETVIPSSGTADENEESVVIPVHPVPEERDLLRRIIDYLESLSSEKRFIFVSYRIDGMSFDRIADTLGTYREAVRRKFLKVESEMYVFLGINSMGGK